jgi:hypothetical protein
MDKREAVRIPVHVPAQCRSASGAVIDCLVEDVSRSGLFLRSPEWMRPGSCAELQLEVAGETLHLTAEVVRVEHNQERAGMGLRIVEGPTRGAARPLANFIMRQHASR